MPSCCAVGCTNKERRLSRLRGLTDITFHCFPRSNPERLQQWIAHTRRANWKPKNWSRLCSLHFTEVDFDRTGQTTRLKEHAIPTVFKFPAHLKKGKKKIELLPPPPKPRKSNAKECKKAAEVPDAQKTVSPNNAVEKSNVSTVSKPLPESHDHSYFTRDTPATLKQKVDFVCTRLSHKKKSLKIAQQKCRRYEKRLQSLHATVKSFKKEKPTPEASLEVLSEACPGVAVEMLKRMYGNKKKGRVSHSEHSPVVLDFAWKLLSISTKAYTFTRQSFDCALPHPSQLRKQHKAKRAEAAKSSPEEEQADFNNILELPLETLMSTEQLSQFLLPQLD